MLKLKLYECTTLCSFHHTICTLKIFGLFTERSVIVNKDNPFLKGGFRPPLGASASPSKEVQAMLDAAFAAQNGKQAVMGMMNLGGTKTTRKIINPDGLSSDEVVAVVKLYDDLVQNADIRTTRAVNIGLIVNEGFLAFENTIGKAAWIYVKKYYGIGCKADTNCLTTEVLKMHLAKMRTIENACAYIDGYWDLIQALHGCLDEFVPCEGVEERHQVITGAKLSLLVMELLCGDWFLQRQMRRNPNATNLISNALHAWLPDYDLCHSKNHLAEAYGPEELFGVYEKFKEYGPKCIVIDLLMREILSLQNRDILKEAMAFCELSFEDDGKGWNIVSTNAPNPYNTIERVMELKKKIHPQRSVRAMEGFLLKPYIQNTILSELWETYAILVRFVDSGKTLEDVFPRFDAAYYFAKSAQGKTTYVQKRTSVRCLARNTHKSILVSGQLEVERILFLTEYLYEIDMELRYFGTNKELRGPVGQVMMAIKVAQKLKCAKAFYVEPAMRIAQEILKMDCTGILKECLKRFINNEEEIELDKIVMELGITPEHLKKWGAIAADPGEHSTDVEYPGDDVKDESADDLSAVPAIEEDHTVEAAVPATEEDHTVEAIDWCDSDAVVGWLIKWAIKNGFKVQDDAEQRNLIWAVLAEKNIDTIKSRALKEIDDTTFVKKIGFEHEYADMYFARDQVDCEKLMDHVVKETKKAKRNNSNAAACTIHLYKYLVDKRLPAGPDLTVMTMNSSLKKFFK